MHDQTYSVRYGKIIRWQALFMALQFSLYGVLITLSIGLPLFLTSYLVQEVVEMDFESGTMIDGMLDHYGRQLGLPKLSLVLDWFGRPKNMIVIAAVGAAVGVMISSFRYFRLRYDAEMLMAVSQIANPDKHPDNEHSPVSSGFLPISLVAAVWTLLFGYLLWPTSAPRVSAAFATGNEASLLLKFDKPLHLYSTFQVAFKTPEKVEENSFWSFDQLGGFTTLDIEDTFYLLESEEQAGCKFNTLLLEFDEEGRKLNPLPTGEMELLFRLAGAARSERLTLPTSSISDQYKEVIARLEEEWLNEFPVIEVEEDAISRENETAPTANNEALSAPIVVEVVPMNVPDEVHLGSSVIENERWLYRRLQEELGICVFTEYM